MFRRIEKSQSETEPRWGGDRSLDKQTINWAFPSLHLALPSSCESFPFLSPYLPLNLFPSLPAFLRIHLHVTKRQKSSPCQNKTNHKLDFPFPSCLPVNQPSSKCYKKPKICTSCPNKTNHKSDSHSLLTAPVLLEWPTLELEQTTRD